MWPRWWRDFCARLRRNAGKIYERRESILDKLHAAVARVTQQQNVREAFVKAQVPMVSASPAEFAAYTRAEVQRWAKIIREHNVTFQ